MIVGAAQLGPIQRTDSRGDVVKRLLALLHEAKARGAELVVFPELALTTFFPRWWMTDQREIDAFFETEMPGPQTQPLFDEARRLGLGFGLGYAAIYLGIAEAALEFAVDYAKKRIVRPDNVPVAHDPTVQRHVGELRARLDAALLVLAEAAAAWEAADMVQRGFLANKAKYLATEVGLDVTSKVIQVVGGRGAYRDYPVERAFRDLRTATLMPPTVDRMLEAIGKSALGIETAMFRFGSGPQGA